MTTIGNNRDLMRRNVTRAVLAAVLLCCAVNTAAATRPDSITISVEDYRDRVYAAWLGQIVGNIYGLSYEFLYIDQAGPDDFPYGFGPSLERIRQVDGAFSDDDTDIEYMYLLQMERHGIEPKYKQLAEAWKHHVRDRVWVANRSALALMHAGYDPPITGNSRYNPNWFQIDPQLVNEIWAVTAPGMIDYATAKSAWAARITNDSFGIEPTIHYAAMYSAAFFEKDIARLIDIGTAALPAGSRFAKAVGHMKDLHQKYPDNWRQARKEMAERYYGEFDYNKGAWPALDAILNGSAAILALLYGAGDFQRTLDIASGLGFDADNQAATMSGLLGIIHGTEGIPEHLLYPLGGGHWKQPFNDRYINVSRHDLPDASIRDMARRTAAVGEKVILANGGNVVSDNGIDYFEIDPAARFKPPFELPRTPVLLAETGREFTFRFHFGTHIEGEEYSVTSGKLPDGVRTDGPRLAGSPRETGLFRFTILVRSGNESREQSYTLRVHGQNLAPSAAEILDNESASMDSIEVIRDGDHHGTTFYNRATDSSQRKNWYGYRWNKAQTIRTLVLNPGLPEEWGGWFTSLSVQYLDENGSWRPVSQFSVQPPLNLDNTQWLKGAYIDHSLSFEPVTTTAIRIYGDAGGIEQDARNGGERRHYTAISELAVYAQ